MSSLRTQGPIASEFRKATCAYRLIGDTAYGSRLCAIGGAKRRRSSNGYGLAGMTSYIGSCSRLAIIALKAGRAWQASSQVFTRGAAVNNSGAAIA